MPDTIDLIIMQVPNQPPVGESLLANIREQARSYKVEIKS